MPEITRTVDIPFLDGQTRTVLMNVSARIEAESAIVRPDGTPTPFYEIANMDGLTPLRALLWAGLRGADHSLRVGQGQLRLGDVDVMLEDIDSNELWVYLSLATVLADKHSVTTEEQRKNAMRRTMETIGRLQEISTRSDDTPSGPEGLATGTSSS
jgi:hypothetical protein